MRIHEDARVGEPPRSPGDHIPPWYFCGIGTSVVSPSHMMLTIHQRSRDEEPARLEPGAPPG